MAAPIIVLEPDEALDVSSADEVGTMDQATLRGPPPRDTEHFDIFSVCGEPAQAQVAAQEAPTAEVPPEPAEQYPHASEAMARDDQSAEVPPQPDIPPRGPEHEQTPQYPQVSEAMEQDAQGAEAPPPPEDLPRGLEHEQAPPRVKPKGAPPVCLDESLWRQARAMEEEAAAFIEAGPVAGPTTPKTAPARAASATPQRPPSRRISTGSAGSHDKMDAILSILKEQRADSRRLRRGQAALRPGQPALGPARHRD